MYGLNLLKAEICKEVKVTVKQRGWSHKFFLFNREESGATTIINLIRNPDAALVLTIISSFKATELVRNFNKKASYLNKN